MRYALSLALTLALTTSSVANAGWSREQRATLNEIVGLENAGKLEEAVARAEKEVIRADAPSGYRRAVAKRGKAAALKVHEQETDPRRIDVRRTVLCSALKMYRTYQADLIESDEERLEIPAEVAELEALAVATAAPCAPAPPEPATQSPPPLGPETSSPPPSAPASTVHPTTEGPVDSPVARPTRTRTRGQIAGGVSLFGAAAGFGAGLAACFAARGPEADRITALDRRATEAGRNLTDDEQAEADAADARYVRLSNGGKALGVFAGVSLIAAVIVLAMPPKNTAKIRARAVGGGVRIEF